MGVEEVGLDTRVVKEKGSIVKWKREIVTLIGVIFEDGGGISDSRREDVD